MNSEKVKEIKEALKQNNAYIPFINEHYNWDEISYADILTLINELESENKELKVVVDIANERTYRKKFTDEWRKEYQKELDKQGNGHIAGHPDFDLVYKLYFEQKDRIAELEKENNELKVDLKNSIDMQKQMLDGFKTTTKEVEENLAREIPNLLKQFAEKVKMAFYYEFDEIMPSIMSDKIDELLKEYEK